jgi:hypothetical protein
MATAQKVNDAIVSAMLAERRIDPYIRPGFDRLFRRPIAAVVQRLIRASRTPDPIGLAEERHFDGEEQAAAAIVDSMSAFLQRTYANVGPAERAGNTKTYGVVRAFFDVLPGLAPHLRHGLFAEPATYPAWTRFAGPGPLAPPDMEDNGVLSVGVKVMGVPGPKLLDEQWTQDFTGISAPTFTTPNVFENVKLQRHVFDGTPVLYFLGPRDHHLLDGIMQGLYSKTQLNPLAERYWSCSSYLLGEGQAMHYSLVPRARLRTRFPRHPSDNYLRAAMADTLRERAVEFDFCVQLQTDAQRMPVEDDGIEWPERLSPFVPVGRLRIPAQRFDTPNQLAFAHNLSLNPWHCVEAHRPLGNQNRARRTIYQHLSEVRQTMNHAAHVEPTGDEVFDDDPVASSSTTEEP